MDDILVQLLNLVWKLGHFFYGSWDQLHWNMFFALSMFAMDQKIWVTFVGTRLVRLQSFRVVVIGDKVDK